MQLPSELEFASYLQYSPRGTGKMSASSRTVSRAVKDDGYLFPKDAEGKIHTVNAIDYLTQRLSREITKHPFLSGWLGPDVLLVPVPRSAPLVHKTALWPARRICEALKAAGLGAEVVEALVRTVPVQKSATASRGQRPSPANHNESTAIDEETMPFSTKKITLIDDVITRGSTFIGMTPHVEAAFPGYSVRCFALVRTTSDGEIEQMIDPVQGTIYFAGGSYLKRIP